MTNSWMDEAACATVVTSPKDDIFFEDIPFGPRDAKALCDACPVKRQCLETALDNGEYHGIWGGADENELRRNQSLGADGKKHEHARPIRCAWCGPNSTRFLEVVERRRTKTHIRCTNCNLDWWTKKIIGIRKQNW